MTEGFVDSPVHAQRWAWAEIDLAAIRHNVAVLGMLASPAQMCVVVKANAYGHGAVPVAHAVLDAGAEWLAVALVDEGVELRRAGITAPILLLSEPPAEAMSVCAGFALTPTVYSRDGILAAGVARVGGVHLKVDTGMARVGVSPADVDAMIDLIDTTDGVELGGIYTHLAAADEPASGLTGEQLSWFAAATPAGALRHTANSAALLTRPDSHLDLVRCGIAVYGISPSPELAVLCTDLRPVMTLKARVSFVKRVPAGSGVSYGHRYVTERAATLATLPIGYADGVPRRLGLAGGEVLINGRRHPIAGVVTMDQLVVDVGDAEVSRGDEVVLIGRQADPGGNTYDEISPWEWATRLDTIAYEITCGISSRVPRVPLSPS
jgi:alanine racemase